MDLLLTHAYFLAEDEHEQQIMKPYPTLGILYICAYLKSLGFDVALFDSTFQDVAAFRRYVEAERPPVVGVYVNLMTRTNALKMVALCKRVGTTVVLVAPNRLPTPGSIWRGART